MPDSSKTAANNIPRHVAIIMDGNGRWARKRHLPRVAGHQAGVEAVRGVVEACAKKKIEVLTLFAFSSENWRRPAMEVRLLMELFLQTLKREVKRMHANKVRVRVIGERAAFDPKLQKRIAEAEELTRDNRGLTVVVAANYGGRWDIAQAARKLAQQIERGEMTSDGVTADAIEAQLSMSDLPEPDLFIRTGGEERISNFLLWQLAYTELYFTEVLWPDFSAAAFDEALASFAKRQRRFGRTGEQVEQAQGA